MNRSKEIRLPKPKRGFFAFIEYCWKFCIGRGERWSHNPLFVAIFTAFVGGVAFVVQTSVQRDNELLNARLQALQEVTGLYGSMASNLDQLWRTRCELMDRRLNKVEVNARSSEIQDRLAVTHERATALTFRLAALFSPSIPWYGKLYHRVRQWIYPVDPVRGKATDDLLYDFQQFYEYYLGFEAQAMTLAGKIPDGVLCANDDASYLQDFNQHVPFKFIRVFNRMAPLLGINKLDVEVRSKQPIAPSQIFDMVINGRTIKMECRVASNNQGQCTPKNDIVVPGRSMKPRK